MPLNLDSDWPTELLSIIKATAENIRDLHGLNSGSWTPERISKLRAVTWYLDKLWKDLNAEAWAKQLPAA